MKENVNKFLTNCLLFAPLLLFLFIHVFVAVAVAIQSFCSSSHFDFFAGKKERKTHKFKLYYIHIIWQKIDAHTYATYNN